MLHFYDYNKKKLIFWQKNRVFERIEAIILPNLFYCHNYEDQNSRIGMKMVTTLTYS